MNTELKALVKTAIDVYALAKGIASKQSLPVLFPAFYTLATDAMSDISGIATLKQELSNLTIDASADADLLAYVTANVAGITSDVHAQKVIAAVCDLIVVTAPKVIALEQAIAAPAAPATPAAPSA